VGKHVTAADLLRAGRRSTGTDGGTTRRLDAEPPSELGVEAPEHLDVSETSRPVAPAPLTYQRATVFLTPEQRRWLKDTVRGLPEGLSGSDVVRLAINRLRRDAELGLALVEELAAQAHSEVGVLTGRRNRGLPSRPSRGD
jgi:hypothetical protein